ncbi:Protein F31C3.6 a [Aphelenchoides avenae]|nr:Protein F31C3.6 a [Aphelenchus avenae]
MFTTNKGADSTWTPSVSLPAFNGTVASQQTLKWPELNKKASANSCGVESVSYLNEAFTLEEVRADVFDIRWRQRDARIIWKGSPTEGRLLEGTIVQIMLKCDHIDGDTCLTFRIAGTLVMPTGEQSPLLQQQAETRHGRFETILIILLSILLFLSVFGSVILWNICWRLKKSELISSLQMQFMYHMKKMEHDKALLDAERCAQEYGHPDMSAEKAVDDGHVDAERDRSSRNVVVKRKLYFSAEFLEPVLLANPPPMAEQFLHDLRRMVEIQRQRLYLRRHVPHLTSIPEETADHYRPYMEDQLSREVELEDTTPSIRTSELSVKTGKRITSEESSPKSTKSTDSGNDSLSSSGETSSPPRNRTSPMTAVASDMTLGHDSRKTQVASQSRIPICASGLTKSPKLPAKGLLTTAPVHRPDKIGLPNGTPPLPATPPPLPPRNMSGQAVERTIKATGSALPISTTKAEPTRPPCAVRTARRKAYAVFPTDSMLKKSLPRRSKKKPMSDATAAPTSVIETNM